MVVILFVVFLVLLVFFVWLYGWVVEVVWYWVVMLGGVCFVVEVVWVV